MKKTMRRAFITMLAAMLYHDAVAASADAVVRFSGVGYDCYADGTPVVDGECYALVWSPKGSTFAGFNADGTTVSADDFIVLAAPLAQGGKCRDTVFQIPAREYAVLKGGVWTVCLVDTRMANGVPAGVLDNVPLRVNRWGVVKSGVDVESTQQKFSATAATATTATTRGDSKMGTWAEERSEVPASLKPPQITSMDVSDGRVRLTVSDTVPYLTYTISSGATPDSLSEDYHANAVDGNLNSTIEIGTKATGTSRFFKVTRAE